MARRFSSAPRRTRWSTWSRAARASSASPWDAWSVRSRAPWPRCRGSGPKARPAPAPPVATSWRLAGPVAPPPDARFSARRCRSRGGALLASKASDSPRAGESPGRQPGAPKEQPPRNLSGPRTARAGHSGKQAFAPHRRGKPQRGEALRSHDRGGAPPRCPHGAAWSREAPMTTPDIDGFAGRHIGPSVDEQAKMLAVVGQGSRADLVDQAVPAAIHHTGLDLPAAADE